MNYIKRKIVAFMRDEQGLTTVEYAVAGGLVAAASILAFTNLGAEVAEVINELFTALDSRPSAAGP